VLPAIVLAGVGMGLIFAPPMATATGGVRPEDAGMTSAMVNASQHGGEVHTGPAYANSLRILEGVKRRAIAYMPRRDEAQAGDARPTGGPEVDVTTVLGEDGGPIGEALRRIADGEASALVLARLRDGARSLRELVALIEWLDAAGADLIALDVGLDTGSEEAASTRALLRELERAEREPDPGRARRGRPGLAAHEPELRERIVAMRERGMSLQTIADALNAEGVPTVRGGARWRPSSVQSALGYRRPRPPLPGAPPHPPAPPHPRGHGPREGPQLRARGPRPHGDPRR
jgi:hypothetical protein